MKAIRKEGKILPLDLEEMNIISKVLKKRGLSHKLVRKMRINVIQSADSAYSETE